jgi:hypothetical protein
MAAARLKAGGDIQGLLSAMAMYLLIVVPPLFLNG